MNSNNRDIKKHSADKVALLLIFALGLLIAQLIIASRTKINLSRPIKLEFAGLSVSVPLGSNWQNSGGWKYGPENGYILAAQLRTAGRAVAQVQWRYLLAPEKIPPSELLSKTITANNAKIINKGQISGNVTIQWAQLELPGSIEDSFVGYAGLDQWRVLELKVATPADLDLAERLFQVSARSINFTPDELLKKGVGFIENIKNANFGTLIKTGHDGSSERAFVIKAADGKNVGFLLEVLADAYAQQRWTGIKSQALQQLGTKKEWFNEDYMFECDGRFDSFVLQTKQNFAGGVSSEYIMIDMAKQGTMSVSAESFGREKIYWPGKAAVPETLLDTMAEAFLDYDGGEVIIDVISTSGRIVPTRLSRIEPQQDKGFDTEAAYAVRLDFLFAKNLYQELYFDRNRQLIGKFEQRQQPFMWHPSDRSSLMKLFPLSRDNIQRVTKKNLGL